jgi:hypothetical protein
MGYQLWTSPLTGYRRKGTRFTDLKQIFIDNVTAKSIYEPLLCCTADSDSNVAKEALKTRDFDVAGIKTRKDGEVIGYVIRDEIENGEFKSYIRNITHELLMSDSTPIAEIFSVLSKNNFAFVMYGNAITGIITKADINKPPIRIYVFGIISLLEMHLNSWVMHYYKDESWKSKVPIDKMGEAKKIYEQRKGNNQDLTILECLQLSSKRELLSISRDFLTTFSFSKNKFKTLLNRAETLRNELVHSQNSIIANIKWNKFVDIIAMTETFLIASDNEVERIAKSGAEFQDLLI